MSNDTIKRSDAIKAIHNYWKKRLDTLPTKESEYGEVCADIQQMDKILEHNKALSNFIKAIPSADRPSVDKEYLTKLIQEAVYDGEACAKLLGLADRPQGDVDAVDIFEREMHNLEQGYITIGEFDERIEPLRHLCYGRPQGEWVRTGRTNIYGGIEVQCSNCGDKVMVQHLEDEWYCRHCGADMGMKGADDDD